MTFEELLNLNLRLYETIESQEHQIEDLKKELYEESSRANRIYNSRAQLKQELVKSKEELVKSKEEFVELKEETFKLDVSCAKLEEQLNSHKSRDSKKVQIFMDYESKIKLKDDLIKSLKSENQQIKDVIKKLKLTTYNTNVYIHA